MGKIKLTLEVRPTQRLTAIAKDVYLKTIREITEASKAVAVLRRLDISTNVPRHHIRDKRLSLRSSAEYRAYLSRTVPCGKMITADKYLGNRAYLTKDERQDLITYLKAEVRVFRNGRRQLDQRRCQSVAGHYWLTAGVHTESNTFGKLKGKLKTAKISVDKKPSSNVRHVGVEIEFISPNDADECIEAFAKANLENHVTLKEDGSVHGERECNGSCTDDCECERDEEGDLVDDCSCECNCNSNEHGHEVCVLATESEYPSIINRVCTVLNELDATVNHTCGLHVHLDMRTRTAETAHANLIKAQGLLFKMVPSSRRSNQYCRLTPSDRRLENITGDSNRYYAINGASMRKHKTIEVRLHTGTTNATKIINWATLLIKIANAPLLTKELINPSDIPRSWRITSRLKAYIATRVNLFRGDRNSHATSDNERTAIAA